MSELAGLMRSWASGPSSQPRFESNQFVKREATLQTGVLFGCGSLHTGKCFLKCNIRGKAATAVSERGALPAFRASD